MAMDRGEILERMAAGAEYIEREDITDEQREKAKEKYAKYEEELKRLDEPSKPKDKAQQEIEKIREMLIAKGAKSRNKPA